jgi:diguanylate cyclase (GGDEF)-like protein
MRSDSRLIIEEPNRYYELLRKNGTDEEIINLIRSHSTSVMFQEIHTEAVEDALKGNGNTKIIDDYRGIPVFSSYVPLNIDDVQWVILSEIEKERVYSSLYLIRDRISVITLILSVLVTAFAFVRKEMAMEALAFLNEKLETEINERKRLELLQKDTMEEKERTIKNLNDLMSFSVIMREDIQEMESIKHMVHILKENFNPDTIAVLLFNRAKVILDVPLIEPRMPVEELIKPETFLNPSICHVLRTGRKIIVRDINIDIPCECISLKIKEGGYACYPLITGGITTGVVILINKEMGYWESKDRQALFAAYVGLAESALHNVRLMDLTRHAAVTDGLTGAYNRRFFDEILEKQILLSKRRNVPLSLLIIDLDHFKRFNDLYGHLTGDKVLRQLTECMKNSIRASDILARYGGEEFAIILPEASMQNALKKADKVRQNVESINLDNIVSGQSVKLTISIGVASFPEHGTDYNTLVNSADGALYKAKGGGRNRVESP